MTDRTALVLGAGFVAGPLVRYLLDRPDVRVRVASLEGAEELVAGHPRGEAIPLDAGDEAGIARLVTEADLVVSLLPPPFHPRVARICVERGRSMVTTSYAGAEMRALDGPARDAGVLLLNEVGVDPGLDHMTALRTIAGIEAAGGRIETFDSHCGGLPAPDADDNPLGYKFSWAPRGVLVAAHRPARYLRDGEVVDVPEGGIFHHESRLDLGGGRFYESYPNGDALAYREAYGLHDARTVYRGTLRFPGHCRAWNVLLDLGLLGLEARGMSDLTWAGLLRDLAGLTETEDVVAGVASKLGMAPDDDPIVRMAWLGLFDDEPLGVERAAPLDLLAGRMLERMRYARGERDMIVMHHAFGVRNPDRRETVTMTLEVLGEPGGDSAMARTVGLPAAVATRLVLDGRWQETGVHIPVDPALYGPILDELEGFGIVGRESVV